MNSASPVQHLATTPLPLPDRGEGEFYQSYTHVYGHAPSAYAERALTLYNNRPLQLSGKLDLRAALWFELRPDVIELWENFALPPEDTMVYAQTLHLTHPVDWQLHQPKTLVTTIVAVVRTPDGNRRFEPCFVCYERQREQPRMKSLIAVQTRWWNARGAELTVLTDATLTAALEWNAHFLLRGRTVRQYAPVTDQQLGDLQTVLLQLAATVPSIRIADALKAAEAAAHGPRNSALAALDVLVTRGLAVFDLQRPFSPYLALKHFFPQTTNQEIN
ncbi:MAG: PDDEXK family nuclease [Candidatus Cryosericum sp.]